MGWFGECRFMEIGKCHRIQSLHTIVQYQYESLGWTIYLQTIEVLGQSLHQSGGGFVIFIDLARIP